jgi:Spy/CpxP family protein refolding chaperone
MGGPDMMRGPQQGEPGHMGGPAMAMLDAIAQLDLTSEQRKKLDALKTDLQQRQQALLGKIAEASEKLREVSRQQSLATRNLSDLRGHMTMANMDTANRAEEMLTPEQRQTLMRRGAHTMTPELIRSAK